MKLKRMKHKKNETKKIGCLTTTDFQKQTT